MIPHERVVEFEQSVFGSVLINDAVFDRVAVTLEARDFVTRTHQIIFQTIEAMYAESKPIDLLSLTAELQRAGYGEIVRPEYVAKLTNVVPSTANVDYYIGQVQEASRRRRLLALARKAQNQLDGGADEDQVIDGMETALVELQSGKRHAGYQPA